MTISLDQINAIINVEQSDLTFVSGVTYTLDTDVFRQTLRGLEDEAENDVYPITHRHVQPISVGGVALARVVEILPHWGVTFEDGQYRVILQGSNNNILDVATINQVSIASTNTAGLTYSKEVEDQSFTDGRVFIDPVAGVTGTIYPNGTTVKPVNNFTDADVIVNDRGLPDAFLLHGAITLTTEDISQHDFIGRAATHDSIDLGTATTTGAVFTHLTLSGTANGIVHCADCVLSSVMDFEGFLVGGAIAGTLSLAGETHLVDVHAVASATESVTIDYQGNSVKAYIPGWEGALNITNHSHASALTALHMKSGTVTIESSCTDGTILLTGQGRPVDNSGAGCTVINQLVDPAITTRLGLNKGDALTDVTSGITSVSGEVDIDRTGDGVTTSTLTRQ